MTFQDGPFLQAACFCETVIEDKTGVLSLIRVIDTVNHTAYGPSTPDQMPKFNYSTKLVIMMKSGRARGRYELKIEIERPSGLKNKVGSGSVHFEGEGKGQNLVMDMHLSFEEEGLYWFHLYLDDELWNSVPLHVKYLRIFTSSAPPR